MALQGTLDTFSLPDVLRLLATTGKTGCLHVDGDRGRGSVWLDDGALVGATADRVAGSASIDQVVFEIMRFDRGSFNFAAGETAPGGRRQPSDVESTLRRAKQLLDEWRTLAAVVPSLNHRVTLAPELTVEQVTVDAPRWQALAAIAGGRSVAELAESLELSELDATRTVSDLVELGVAVVEPPGPPRTPPSGIRRVGSTASAGGGDVRSRNGVSDAARRTPAPAAPANGKLEARREPRAHEVTAKVRGENGRSSWREDATASVDTAPKPRGSKSASTRAPRARRTGPTPTALAPKPPVTAPTSNGQALTGTAISPALGQPTIGPSPLGPSPLGPSPLGPSPLGPSPLAPAPTSPFPTVPPMTAPTPMPPGAMTAPVPALPNTYQEPMLPRSLDTGRLGPSPLAHDTGQIPSIGAEALPPDLTWAAEDNAPAMPAPPPGALRAPSGRLLASPSHGPVNGRSDDPAQHVTAMSPQARAAVEATLGRAGGATGGQTLAGVPPEQAHGRSQLLSFLSTVRQ